MKFHYPTEVNYSCHNSGFCCQSALVPVAGHEKKNLEKLPIAEKIPEFKDATIILPSPIQSSHFILNLDTTGRCCFLDDKNLCKLHREFGGKKKPMACQIFPYMFTAAPDGIYVGLKFSCPSVASSKGEPLAQKSKEIENLFKTHSKHYQVPQLEEKTEIGEKELPWTEVKEIESLLIQTLKKDKLPFSQRLLVMLDLYNLLSQSLGASQTKKRIEFWKVLAEGTWKNAEKTSTSKVKGKKLAGSLRKLYQQMVYYYSKSLGQEFHPSAIKKSKKSLALLIQGLNFMYGRGSFSLPFTKKEVPVKQVMKKLTSLDGNPDFDELLAGYFITKIQSQSFFGPGFFSYSFVDGLNFLAFMYPILCWYTTAYALTREDGKPQPQDLIYALRCVDFTNSGSFLFEGTTAKLRNRCIRKLKIPRQVILSLKSSI